MAFRRRDDADKRNQDETTDKLDSDFTSLQELLAPTMRPLKGSKEAEALPKDKLDDFDIATRSFAFEQRARAQDRSKSDAEVAVPTSMDEDCVK